MTTDTSEKALEALIVAAMTGDPAHAPAGGALGEAAALYGGSGWLLGHWQDYDREYAVDLAQLAAFLTTTQPGAAAALPAEEETDAKTQEWYTTHASDVEAILGDMMTIDNENRSVS